MGKFTRKVHSTIYQLEREFYDRDKFGWSIYTALGYAPKDKVKELWEMLTPEQQDGIRTLRRVADDNSKG